MSNDKRKRIQRLAKLFTSCGRPGRLPVNRRYCLQYHNDHPDINHAIAHGWVERVRERCSVWSGYTVLAVTAKGSKVLGIPVGVTY